MCVLEQRSQSASHPSGVIKHERHCKQRGFRKNLKMCSNIQLSRNIELSPGSQTPIWFVLLARGKVSKWVQYVWQSVQKPCTVAVEWCTFGWCATVVVVDPCGSVATKVNRTVPLWSLPTHGFLLNSKPGFPLLLVDSPPTLSTVTFLSNLPYTLRKKGARTLKGFFGCPLMRTLWRTLFGLYVEPFPQKVVHETQKGSTWNQKGFFYGDSWITLFSESVMDKLLLPPSRCGVSVYVYVCVCVCKCFQV
jgi:hypothetical protein